MAGNLVKPLMHNYGTEWRERGYGLWTLTNLAPVTPHDSTYGLCIVIQRKELLRALGKYTA